MSRALRRAAQCVVFTAIAWCVAAAAVAPDPAWLVSQRITLGGAPNAASITDLAIDAQGNTVLVGTTGTDHFPGVDSARVTNGGLGLRFVVRLDANGVRQSVTVVGSPVPSYPTAQQEWFDGFAVDASGNAYVIAYDGPYDLPAGGVYRAPSPRPFVYRVSPLGQVTQFPIPLDPAIRRVHAMAADSGGNVYLAGSAAGGLVTTVGAPYPSAAVGTACVAPFVAKWSPSGTQPLYATYLAYSGTQGEPCSNRLAGTSYDPGAYAVALDDIGNAYVAGQAETGARATPGAVDLAPKVPTILQNAGLVASHAFLTKVDASGSSIAWSVRLGGENRERATSVAIDPSGNVYVGGKTTSASFPSFGGALPRPSPAGVICLLNTPEMGFIAKLASDGSRILWSGYLPAAGSELDECGAGLVRAPVRISLDRGGGVAATGFGDPSIRLVNVSRNALANYGDAFFYAIDANGGLVYSTWYTVRAAIRGAALDSAGNLRVAGGSFLRQLSAGRFPVDVLPRISPACEDAPLPIDALVAAAGDIGSVSFRVDGVGAGTVGVRAGIATLSVPLARGVHRIDAMYSGATIFDGYVSPLVYLAVNQAGACT